jgi:U6 snRNA-associated Sm-like protein LSm4
MLPLSLLKTSQGHPMVRRADVLSREAPPARLAPPRCPDTARAPRETRAIARESTAPRRRRSDGSLFFFFFAHVADAPLVLFLRLVRPAFGPFAQLVELKNGETYNGHLVSCDTWMNVHLKEVICTSKDGDRFWRMANCYVRGNTIKYICVPDEVIGLVEEENLKKQQQRPMGGRGRGRGGRDGGRGGRGEGFQGGRGGRGGRDGGRGGRGGRGGGR